MAISANTILTAAHCPCTEDDISGNDCQVNAWVRFRTTTGALSSTTIHGVTAVHPNYNPTLTGQLEHDLAVIRLDGVGPAHVPAFSVGDHIAPVNAPVMVAGFGRTGADCQNPGGTLNYDMTVIDGYEDGNDFLVTDNPLVHCKGDSGGPVLEADGSLSPNTILAVFSGWQEILETDELSTTTAPSSHFDWIKGQMCPSTSQNNCNGHAELCSCSASSSVLWRNSSTGSVAVWEMDGGEIVGWPTFYAPLSWDIKGTGDFNGDRHGDILWQQLSGPGAGQVAIWYTNDGSSAAYPGGTNAGWTIQGTGDFDNNGRSDILWRETTGQLAIWLNGDNENDVYPSYMNQGGVVPLNWTVLGVGDFDGDSRSDIFWRDQNGATAIWIMNGGSMMGDRYPGTTSNAFQAIGDFDNNLRSDVLWRAPNGQLQVWFNGGWLYGTGDDQVLKVPGPSYANSLTNGTPTPVSTAWQVQRVADFNHDGRDDILWRSGTSLALWYLDGIRFLGDEVPYRPNEPPVAPDASWVVKGMLKEAGF
jgi:hypothetical protein